MQPATEPDRAPVAVHELAGLLMGATEQVRASFEAVCARYELTPQQARALLRLKDKAPMRSLADQLCCDASNITGIADRLEARDLVRREAPQTDRRVKLLALTPQGELIRKELQQAVLEESPVMAKLAPAERETLKTLLTKVTTPSHADGQTTTRPKQR